jgi:hypothetical protein
LRARGLDENYGMFYFQLDKKEEFLYGTFSNGVLSAMPEVEDLDL